jgi:AmmeMemoRadiSam system protein A
MDFVITEDERRTLLACARESIAAKLAGRKPAYPAPRAGRAGLAARCGAFVSLHNGENLRGCIGRLTSDEPLEKTVRVMAQEAAFGDPRFPVLTAEELDSCRIEISALSPLEPCADVRAVRVGVHGLYLRHRGRTGVLLPQVPLEQGWDLDGFLAYLCVTAGLPAGSCDAPGAELYTFTAVVFGEERR